ncbi:MAG: FKBP-type peptidyl-prolyl cis-trans isomerase [Bacteroidales bacterium]|nr:FKBP-type peptidyl-prolyl cis-trans isomerase [Bacteroidales bacterium]
MKLNVLIIIAALSMTFGACSNKGVDNLRPETQDDSLAYAFGVDIYNNLQRQSDLELDPLFLAKGMKDAKEGNSIFIDAAAGGYIMMVMEEREENKLREQFSDYIAENEKFLEENKEKEGVITTESGLQYKVIEMGDGPRPALTDTVRVHYTGKLINDTVFDSSVERGEPAQFRTNGLIKGWSEGLQLMPEGSKFMFYVPQELGYGARGAGQTIQPFSTLIFEVELLEVVNKEE